MLLHSRDDNDLIKVRPEIWLGKPAPHSGSTYLEIYDTARSRSTDQIVCDLALWVGNDGQYLLQPVLNMSIRGQNCLLVALPETNDSLP